MSEIEKWSIWEIKRKRIVVLENHDYKTINIPKWVF